MTHFDITGWLRFISLSLFPVAGIAAGYFVASIFGVVLSEFTPPSKSGTTEAVTVSIKKRAYQTITRRNVFDSSATQSTEPIIEESSTDASVETAKVRVDLTLLGTVVAGRDSLAIIKGNKEIEIFHLDDVVPGGGKVDSIKRKAVYIEMPSGEVQVIKLDENSVAQPVKPKKGTRSTARTSDRSPTTKAASGIEQIAENKWLIPKEEADRSRTNLNELLKTARMSPNIVDGETVGFRVAWLKRGSFLDTLGIKKGDILMEVNGTDLNGPEKALQIFQQLREARRITIGFDRRGEKHSYEYEIN